QPIILPNLFTHPSQVRSNRSKPVHDDLQHTAIILNWFFCLIDHLFHNGKGVNHLSGALKHIRILDLSRVLAGPYCTMILGDLGAECIKVEAPGGSDETRKWGPPFKNNVSAYYLCTNRNKKSITVDLKTTEGIDVIKKLVYESDVIIHNFKTGTMERSEEHTSELQSRFDLVCRLLLEKTKVTGN